MSKEPIMYTASCSEPANDAKLTSMTTVLLGVVAVVLVVLALRQAQAVLIPLILAWMISQILAPMVRFFARCRIPTGLATMLALLALLFAMYWTAIFISASVASFAVKLPDYSHRISTLVMDSIRSLSERFVFLSNEAVQSEIRNEVAGLLRFVMSAAGSAAGALGGLLAKLVLVFIMAAFMLVAKPYTENKVRNALPERIASRVNNILGSISIQISHYLAIQFLLSLITGVLVWLTCRIVGVDAAVTWGALAFFLNFIPTIGSIIAAIPPVLLALLQFDTLWPALWTLAAIVAINQVIGAMISPKVMGDRMNLSPVTVLLSLLFWGWLWGIGGAFLSVIITASIKIVFENIEFLRPAAKLMESGRAVPVAQTGK